MIAYKRWVTMAALCMSGGMIFMLPFLREIYYIPMQIAFGFSNTQMGMLMSTFGATSLLAYFPGGWLADLFSPRRLMTFALFSTGLVGLYFSTLPSYEMCLLIHGYWGASISLVFWSAMIKATRNWAPREKQGRAFGILEGGRGITEALSGSIFGAVFIWLGSNDLALTQVIILFSCSNMALGILVWFSMEKRSENNQETSDLEKQKSKKKKVSLQDIIGVLKIQEVWLIAIVIMTAYSSYWGSYYFAPYATSAMGMSVAIGVTIGLGKAWLNPCAAIMVGLFSDRIGISRAILGLQLFLVVTFFAFGIFPHQPNMMGFVLVNIIVTAFAVYALRGIYYALLEEGGIPIHLTGTAAGIVSVIGYMPDIYMPFIGGIMLDSFSGTEGYRYLFFMISGLCLIGACSAFKIMKLSQARKNNENLQARRLPSDGY